MTSLHILVVTSIENDNYGIFDSNNAIFGDAPRATIAKVITENYPDESTTIGLTRFSHSAPKFNRAVLYTATFQRYPRLFGCSKAPTSIKSRTRLHAPLTMQNME